MTSGTRYYPPLIFAQGNLPAGLTYSPAFNDTISRIVGMLEAKDDKIQVLERQVKVAEQRLIDLRETGEYRHLEAERQPIAELQAELAPRNPAPAISPPASESHTVEGHNSLVRGPLLDFCATCPVHLAKDNSQASVRDPRVPRRASERLLRTTSTRRWPRRKFVVFGGIISHTVPAVKRKSLTPTR